MSIELSYETLVKLHKALDIIESGTLDNLYVGHYELFDGVYVNIMMYEMKEEGVFESHHEYIDVHYPIEGSERIEILEEDKLEITEPYDSTKDCVLGKGKGESFLIREKQAFVVMPGEAHIPGLKVNEVKRVKKAVVKVPIR